MRISDWSSDVCSSDLRFDLIEPHMALFHQVEQPARRRHDEVEAARKRLGLRRLTDAAEDGGPAELQVAAVVAGGFGDLHRQFAGRSDEHTSELQSLMRISYAVFCLTKQTKI